MTIEVSPEIKARLESKAQAEGVSVGAYVERLVFDEESRVTRLAAFRQAIEERLGSLNAGESLDGEEVMARLITEFDAPVSAHSTR
jgi:predicted transcriptional regulator